MAEDLSPHTAPHADKFRVALAGLIGIALGAVAVAIAVLVSQGSAAPQQARWSSWSPDGPASQVPAEIADHVSPLYRLDGADQLAVVSPVDLSTINSAGNPTGNGLIVAVNTSSSSSSRQNLSLLAGSTVAYNICGLGGSDCAVAGTGSITRGLLLRREALELALYTFKYMSGIQNVVALLPPGRTEPTTTLSPTPPNPKSKPVNGKLQDVAVLFVRSELTPWLDAPLDETLAQFPPTVSQLPLWKQTEEASLVDQITGHGLFSEHVESQQDGSNLLVLNQLPPQ